MASENHNLNKINQELSINLDSMRKKKRMVKQENQRLNAENKLLK
jgi:hypothetical protein